MRNIPVETAGLTMRATGAEPQAVNKYADGVRTEAQESDDKGRALCRVSLFVITDEGAEEIRVKVPSANVQKGLAPLAPVVVVGLFANPYVSGNSRVAVSYRAESIAAVAK
jgi:hypothetical protein